MRAPDRFADEPIVAWRAWRVDLQDALLLPTFYVDTYIWPPGRAIEAKCANFHVRRDHVSPEPGGCSCGVHAYRDPEEAIDRYFHSCRFKPLVRNSIPAWGRVNMWGRVMEHERGYRSQYAYPYEVTIPAEVSDEIYMEHRGVFLGAPRPLEDYDPVGLAQRVRNKYAIDVEVA